jgi:hypothetical protein
MERMYYIGLDVHKKTISYCVKDVGGRIHLDQRAKDYPVKLRDAARRDWSNSS